MDLALLVARLLVAAVFLVAGVAKLADRAGSRRAMEDFGLPARLATPFGSLLPLAEIAVGIGLLPLASARYAAGGALALLLLFVAGIGVNLARGKHPDCHCFGQLHSSPAGWSTLVRNAGLAAVAGFIVWQGWQQSGRSAVSWTGDLSFAGIVGLIGLALVIVEGWVLVHMVGQNGRVLLRLDALEASLAAGVAKPATVSEAALGLPVGAPAPAFSLPGLHGETLTLESLLAGGKPVALVFSNPGCGPCNALLPELGRWQRENADRVTIALIGEGSQKANRAKSTEHGMSRVLLQAGREVAESYQADGTPMAVVVRPDGTIGSPLASGADEVRALILRTIELAVPAALSGSLARAGSANGNAAHSQPGAAAIGDPAPAFTLPDLDGRSISLADFRGHPTVVLFWNLGCGYCANMLDDLRAWEAKPPAKAPQLLVVSTGDVEANRAMGLRSTVVLDQSFAVGQSFGTDGTPTAVLVDADGRIASGVGDGVPGVLALLNGKGLPAKPPATNGHAVPAPSLVGQRAPNVRLPDLTGKTVNLSSFRGSPTLVLFWNPGCGFCRRMLDDLKAWEANRFSGAPNLVVVSTGEAEANRAMGLQSPVLLDQSFETGRAFGATGTPSAVLIDAQGKIASERAVGAEAVFALAAQFDQPKVVTT
ncbi:MAG: redoxin domain-containing protein [Thermomicrobiales bacterium]